MYKRKKRIATDFPNLEVIELHLDTTVEAVRNGRSGKVVDRFSGVSLVLFTSCGEVMFPVLFSGTVIWGVRKKRSLLIILDQKKVCVVY